MDVQDQNYYKETKDERNSYEIFKDNCAFEKSQSRSQDVQKTNQKTRNETIRIDYYFFSMLIPNFKIV